MPKKLFTPTHPTLFQTKPILKTPDQQKIELYHLERGSHPGSDWAFYRNTKIDDLVFITPVIKDAKYSIKQVQTAYSVSGVLIPNMIALFIKSDY